MLLANGQVLISGGENQTGALSDAELYDPASGGWIATASLTTARTNHTATLLSTGKTLSIGGQNQAGFLNSAELYDPGLGFAESWRPVLISAPVTVTLGMAL